MTVDPESTDSALRSVAARYASGVDRRDRELFLSAFTEDALLIAPGRNDTPLELRGHGEIGTVIELISRYPRTFHFVGQARYEFGAAETAGEVYCIAHHISPEGDRDLVMFVRYHDSYRRAGAAKTWLIERRVVQVDWIETHPIAYPKEDQL